MITLKADNRSLTLNAEFSYLSTNYAAAVSSFVLTNVTSFAADDYLLFGEWGAETTEVLKVSSVTAATNTIVTTANSKFAHPESTKITIIKYNQVRFYRSTSSTDTNPDPLATYQDIEPDDFYSKYYDTTNTTGFGFFLFYNATTLKATAFSNPIPYADFGSSTVSKIFDSFFSLLNNKEKKLIADEDTFRWLNEAYSITTNELNLVNDTFNIPAQSTISAVSGTAEYSLPSDFSSVLSFTDASDGTTIPYLPLREVAYYRDSTTFNTLSTRYYIRGSSIGLVPTPTASNDYYLYYRAKMTEINSYDDSITLPNNEFYFLVDFMMYRAAMKLSKPYPDSYLKLFLERIKSLKITSHKQHNEASRFDYSQYANV